VEQNFGETLQERVIKGHAGLQPLFPAQKCRRNDFV